MVTVCDACAQNQASPYLPPAACRCPRLPAAARVARVARGNGVRICSSDPTSTRAGGQDDVSYTNSLKLYTITLYSIFYTIYGIVYSQFIS